MELMTDAEYVDVQGLLCPKCRSEDIGPISRPEVVSDSPVIIQEIKCDGCGFIWADEYCLTNFSYNEEDEDE